MTRLPKISALILSSAAFALSAPVLASESAKDAAYKAPQTDETKATPAVLAPQDDPEAVERL